MSNINLIIEERAANIGKFYGGAFTPIPAKAHGRSICLY